MEQDSSADLLSGIVIERLEPGGDGAASDESTISSSAGFPEWLSSVGASLAFTSYGTGQLFLIGLRGDRTVSVSQANFLRAMGIHAAGDRLLVGGLAQIWSLANILRPGESDDPFDRVYVPRSAATVGDVDVHEVATDRLGRTIFVNTKYSCLATTSDTHSFQPIWKPPFVTRLAAEDRCHLNGLCMADGIPRYVTAVSRSDVLNGWRERRHEGGLLIDVRTNRIVTDRLSMPHSPRCHAGAVWALDSGRGYLVRIDPDTGRTQDIVFCPGFLRGLAFIGRFAVVTTSLAREGTFKALPLEDNIRAAGVPPSCGLLVIDTEARAIVEWLRIAGHIRELFDVAVLPGVRCPTAVSLGSHDFHAMITFEPQLAPM